MFREVRFESLGELTPCQHDSPPAASAFESDIRAQPGDGPFVGAARVLLSETQVIVEPQVG